MSNKIVKLLSGTLLAGGAFAGYQLWKKKSQTKVEVGRTFLTGLREWNSALQREIVRSHRDARDVCIATLKVNGVDSGSDDKIKIEKDLLATVRGSDLLAGNSDCEYFVLFPEAGLDEGYEAVERLQEILPSTCSLAAGIAVWDHCETPAELVSRAVASMNGEDKSSRGKITVSEIQYDANDDVHENVTPTTAQ